MLPKQGFKAKEKSQITCFEKEANFFIKKPAKTVSNGGKKYQNVAKLLPNLGFKAKEKLPNRCFRTIWEFFGVVPPGIEPGTQGFSVLCSTN